MTITLFRTCPCPEGCPCDWICPGKGCPNECTRPDDDKTPTDGDDTDE